ncbi:MAG TPA: hypothetical protein VNK48_05650 [Xanthobacteraceae bacterium]|nr:hypothetical protein [Xanthobacteraceae bacterium]
MTATFENLINAAQVHAESLRDVVLTFAEEMPLPDFDSIVEGEPWTWAAERWLFKCA